MVNNIPGINQPNFPEGELPPEVQQESPPETNTNYKDDSVPYIVTSEKGQTKALNALANYPPAENGVYLGFAFEFNYNILVRRPFKKAIICDINKRMHEVYQWIAEAVVEHEDRRDFLSAFKEKLNENDNSLCNMMKKPKEIIDHYQNKKFMWTYDEDLYAKIREMHQNNLISYQNLDLIEDGDYFEQLHQWADRNGYVFDTVYVSNIPEWAQRSGFQKVKKMKDNLLKIMNSLTVFIDAKQEKFESGEPIIRLSSNIYSRKSFPSFTAPKRKKARRPSGLQNNEDF